MVGFLDVMVGFMVVLWYVYVFSRRFYGGFLAFGGLYGRFWMSWVGFWGVLMVLSGFCCCYFDEIRVFGGFAASTFGFLRFFRGPLKQVNRGKEKLFAGSTLPSCFPKNA